MKKINVFRSLLLAFSFALVVSVGVISAPTATTAHAANVAATEWGNYTDGMGKVVFGNWTNYSATAGNPAGYSLSIEEDPRIAPYLLLDGLTFADFEAENPQVNLAVNRFMNTFYVIIIRGVLPEFTIFTVKQGCPMPHSGDGPGGNTILSGDTVDKDYNLIFTDGVWSKPSSELSVSNFSELSEPVVSGDYTDVSFRIPFNNQIIDNPTDNLTGTPNSNARSKMYFNGVALSNLSTGTPSAGNVSIPKIGASGRYLTITFRMRTDSFDISAIERKAFRIDSGLRLPNYSSGGLFSPATGIYNGSRIVRYYIDEAKCWIRSSVQKANIDFCEENQLYLSGDTGNFELSYDSMYFIFPIMFSGDNAVLPAGTNLIEKYNQHYSQLYGTAIASGSRTEESVDKSIGGGYYMSLLDNVKINGVKLSEYPYYGTNNVRVDYYSSHMLIWSPVLDFNNSVITVTLDGGLFFPSGKNMNGRSVNIVFKPGQKAVTDIAVDSLSAEKGYDTLEESKNDPVSIAVNEVLQVNATVIPYDAWIKYLTYEVVEESEPDMVKITKKGVLTAKKTGNVTIRISAIGGEGEGTVKYVTYNISELALDRIALEKESETIFVGASVDLQVYFSPMNASYKDLTYTSSDESIAKVENGKVTGLKGGTAVITVRSARYPSVTAIFNVTIAKRVVSVSVSKPAKTSYRLGENLDTTGMVVKATYDDGTSAAVPITMVSVAGYSKSKLGSQEINVIYEGFYDSFQVSVSADAAADAAGGCGGFAGVQTVLTALLLIAFAAIGLNKKLKADKQR